MPKGYCEDYPACGHTFADPCTSLTPSALDYANAWEENYDGDF